MDLTVDLWHVSVDSGGLITGGITGIIGVLAEKTFPLVGLTQAGGYVTVTLDMAFEIPAGGLPSGEALALVLRSDGPSYIWPVDTCAPETDGSPGAPMISILTRGTTTGSPTTPWSSIWVPSGEICSPGLRLTVIGCDQLPPPGPPEQCEGDGTEVQDFLNNLIDPQVSSGC